jgi:malonyl CoA-acyl carrier protein transacylase
MKRLLWVFPGQGSQRRGMGDGLFERYPELVMQADQVLGRSLRELCLTDPDGVLHRTEYTQPALFAVSALSFLARRDDGAALPDIYAGHSLGEFTALFAAGAFDFATGMELVAKRGALMSKAPQGAMAAIVGPDLQRVRNVLRASGLDGIDVANINSGSQTVISGPHEDIERSEAAFVAIGARYVKLNVSAPFHSRYMRDVESAFRGFVDEIAARGALHPLCADVISNRTALPHARDGYLPQLIEQITQPVNWYESISRLLTQSEIVQEEIGPGDVLTGLLAKIRKMPMHVDQGRAASTALAPHASTRPRTVFMYSGQGSQYYGMGRELYAGNRAFRDAMDACNRIYRDAVGRDMIAELYDEANKWRDMTDIMLSHPALFSVGYSLTIAMEHAGVRPDCVVGYSLGEYAASIAAGTMSHADAMQAVVSQARLFKTSQLAGGMLSVLAPKEHFDTRADIYQDTVIASINFAGNFVISGGPEALAATARRLDAESVVTVRLAVEYPFHSPLLRPIESAFRAVFDAVPLASPSIPQYSSNTGGRMSRVDSAHYWNVTREQLDFHEVIRVIADEEGPCRFVDLGPMGTLSGFIKHGFGGRLEHVATMNQFGRNIETLGAAIGKIAA